MALATLLVDKQIENVIAKHQVDTKKLAKQLREVFHSINLNILLKPIQNTFYLKIDSQILISHPKVCFVNEKGTVVAHLQYQDGQCELKVLDTEHIIDVYCQYEGDLLSIKSLGSVHLSGDIKLQSLQIDCKTCVIQDTEVESDKDVIQHYSYIKSSKLILRSKESILLQKHVHLDAEQLYFSSQVVLNKATISSQESLVAVETVINEGRWQASSDFSGFTLEFQNKGILEIDRLFTLATYQYTDAGHAQLGVFNLQTDKANFSGELKIKQESQILANGEVYFHPKAILETQGLFSAQCDGDIHFSSYMKHIGLTETKSVIGQIQFSANKTLKILSHIILENSELILIGREKLNIDAMLSADKQSNIYLESESIEIQEQLFQFRKISGKAIKKITISKPFLACNNITLEADCIDVAAVLESEEEIRLKAKKIAIAEDGKALAKHDIDIDCDSLSILGDIISKGALHLGVNYFTYISGNIAAEQTYINTAIYVNLGSVGGDVLFEVNSIAALSAGLVYAGQYKNNALLNIDLGLRLSQMPGFKQLWKKDNLIELVKLIGKNCVPHITQSLILVEQTYNWLGPIVMAPYQSYEFLVKIWADPIAQLEAISVNPAELTKIPLHRFIAEFVRMRDKAFVAKDALKQVSSLENLCKQTKEEFKNLKVLYEKKQLSQVTQGINPKKIAKTYITGLLPTHSSRSLVHLNGGIAVTLHSDLRSKHLHNCAFYAALASLSINADELINTGGLAAIGEISLEGKYFRNEAFAVSQSAVNANFEKIEFASHSTMPMHSWHVNAEAVIIKENQRFELSHLKTKTLQCEKDSELNLKQSHFDVDQNFEQMPGSRLYAEDSSLNTQDIKFDTQTQFLRSTIKAAHELKQTGNLISEKTSLVGKSITLDGAKLTDGEVRAESKLTIQHAETSGTALSGGDLNFRDATFKGCNLKIKSQENSESVVDQKTLENKNEFSTNQIIATEHLHTEGVVIEGMQVNAQKMDAEQTIVRESQIKIHETFYAKNLETEKSVFQADKVKIEGKTFANESIIESKNDFDLQGTVKGANSLFRAKTLDIKAIMQGKEKFNIDVEDQLIIHKDAKLDMEALKMKARIFNNSGKISTTQGYVLEAERAYNWWDGGFDVKGGSLFDVKQVLVNSGKMYGDNMTINTGIYANLLGWTHTNKLSINALVYANIAGDIAGYDHLTVNAGFALNAGLMRSMHTHCTSLASYNFGLYLPALPSYSDQLWSFDTACNVGTTLLYNVLPGSIKGAYSLTQSGSAIFDSVRKVGKQAIHNPKSINVGEVVGLLAGVKGIVNIAMDYKESREETDEKETQKPSSQVSKSQTETAVSENKGLWNGVKSTMYQATTDYIAEQFIPTISYDSTYHHNGGAMFSANISERGVSASNSGRQLALNYKSRTAVKENSGIIKADQADIKAENYIQQDGKMQIGSGKIAVDNFKVHHGQLDLNQTKVSVKQRAEFHENAHIKMKDSAVTSNHIFSAATFNVEGKNLLHAHMQLDTADSNHVTGSGVMEFKAHEGAIKGILTSKGAVVDIEKLDDLSAILYGKKTYQQFQPSEYLKVITPDVHNFDHDLSRDCKVELIAKGIDIKAPLSLKKGFRFETTQADVEISGNITTQGNGTIKSARHLRNNKAQVVASGQLDLETTGGDLTNLAGVFHGQNYLHAKINGDVHNLALATQTQGKYGLVTEYQVAQLLGGKRPEDGRGLTIQATGKVINDASIIKSQGHNLIHAKKGYEGSARTSNFIAEQYKKHGWFSGGEKQIKKTNVFISNMISTDGRNIVIADEGGINSDAASFMAKEGSDLFARDDINLKGVKTTEEIKKHNYSFFGLFSASKNESHENMIPTVIYDLGHSQIRSHQGNIDALDTCFMGRGTLAMKAKNVAVKSSFLQHTIDSHQRSLSIDAFGLPVMYAIFNKQNFVSPLLRLDQTLSKLDPLWHSKNPVEFMANAWNTTVSAYNTYQTFDTALLQRYGLSDHSGFNPTFSLAYQATQSHQNYQTVSTSCIQLSGLEVEAENKFSVMGTPIIITGDMSVKAKTFEQEGVSLKSDFNSQSSSVSMAVTPKGGLASIGASHQQQERKQIDQHTQHLCVGGKLKIDVDNWKMDHASTDVDSISGHVEKLDMQSRQSTQSNSDISAHVATTGVVGFSVTSGQSAMVNEKTTISVRNSKNSNLIIESARLQGSEIQSVDNQGIKINSVDLQQIEDKAQGHGFGIVGNVCDLIPSKVQEIAIDSSQLISTASLHLSHHSYHAINPSITNAQNELPHKTVLVDRHFDLQFDVPVSLPHKKDMEVPHILTESEKLTDNPLMNVDVFDDPLPVTNDPEQEVVSKIADQDFHSYELLDNQNDCYEIQTTTPFMTLPARVMDHSNSQEKDTKIVREPISPKVEIASTGFDLETQDIRIGKKMGRNGKQQYYDIDDGKYVSKQSALRKVINKAEINTDKVKKDENKNFLELKINSDGELFNQSQLFWQSNLAFENSEIVFKPTIIGNYFGNYSSEINLSEYAGSAQVDMGSSLRFHFGKGNYSGMLGQIKFAADIASVHANVHCSANTDRGATMELSADLGVMGPNASFALNSDLISILGLTFQTDLSLQGGLGVKCALGCGATLDKTQPKLRVYKKLGFFSGIGMQVECNGQIGIDAEAPERFHKEVEQMVAHPMYKKTLNELRSAITEAKKENPTTFWGSFWNAYKISAWSESENDILESIGNAASTVLLFDIRKSGS